MTPGDLIRQPAPATDINLAPVRAVFAGRFEIERELGRGSIASVYAARDPQSDERVALKVLLPELSETMGAGRFRQEIAIGSALEHPFIVPIYRSGRADGFLYFSMPFLEGESLAQRLDRAGPLEIGEALRIVSQVAEALDFAHERGVVHRDIKPANLMLTPGAAIVMDFGIARLVGELGAERLTRAGLAMGSPLYMSPEQATGKHRLDGRADQYSLACVLYEMLAGHPPFYGVSTQTVLTRHARDPVPPLRSARADVAEPLEAVVIKALSKRPRDRFRTVSRFSQALEVAARGVWPRGVQRPGHSPGRRGATWALRAGRSLRSLWPAR